jgi:hypothetical protein
MPQPAKVATPAMAFVGFAVQARVAPAGVVMVKVIDAVLVFTVLAPASWTVTTGWAAKATPPVELDGPVVKANVLAAPAVMVTLLLVAEVSSPSVAVSVYTPTLSIWHPVKVMTPATAALGFGVQTSVAPAGVVNAKVTKLVSVMTVLPPASWTATTGCVDRAVPLIPVELGEVVKASRLGTLTTTSPLDPLVAVQLL